MKDLVFFDKEGNYLNFQYDTNLELYTGDLIFHENSNDTYKTIGIYMFERLPAFEFSDELIKLEKFQLFNEYGINMTGNIYASQSITKIEASNNDPSFKSKWIFGNDFEKKFPIGSEIRFDEIIFEFTNTNQNYTVVSSKKGAIMIISDLDNQLFNATYSASIGLTSSYTNKTISGLNTIGIHNYLGTNSTATLSDWSEPRFYSLLYNNRKLNLIGTKFNDSVVTIKNKNLNDKQYYEYSLPASSFSQSSSLWIELIMKTDLPLIYQGSMNVLSNKIEFNNIPSILKPGTKFKILSNINTDSYIVDSIDYFNRDNRLRYYDAGQQVLWNNTIYECVSAYTQSATSSITPEDTLYWTTNINYLPVGSSMSAEVLADTQLYLINNTFTFGTSASTSTASNQNELTLASSAEKWADELKNFNITLTYNNDILKAALDYASPWAVINFYRDVYGSASLKIGTSSLIAEKTIEVEEELVQEFNSDYSELYDYSIVFTDIDEYGIIITINGLDYAQEVQWVYNGLSVDLKMTIDKTLRAWLETHYFILLRLGIKVSIDFTESDYPYLYCDTLKISTFYPNIPITFDIKVGTTANWYLRHSDIQFYEIGPVLNITCNGRQYQTTFGTQSYTVSEKLQLWIDDHQDTLQDFEIFINNKNNLLNFNTKEQLRSVFYTVYIGRTPLPGENSFEITKRIKGNPGSFITSNAVILATGTSASATFFDVDGAEAGDISFATGMITSVNNSIYPFNNQDYNLIEVNKDRLVLSYQGPFWGGTTSLTENPQISISYDSGFTQSISGPDNLNGLDLWKTNSFSKTQGFDAYRGYTSSSIDIPVDTLALSDITDMTFVPNTSKMYVFGSCVKVFDATTGQFIETLIIPGISTPVRIIYNSFDGYLYCLTYNKVYRINTVSLEIQAEISLGYTATSKTDLDIEFNTNNGDVYISCISAESLKKISPESTTTVSIYTGFECYKMAFDQRNNKLWVISESDTLREFDCETNAESNSFSISGISSKNLIAYNRKEESVFVMGNNLNSVKSSSVISFNTIPADSSNYLLYDNINDTVLLSRNTLFTSVNYSQVIYNESIARWGSMIINQYDERVYLAAEDAYAIYVIEPLTGSIVNQIGGFSDYISKMIYNPTNNSVWAIIAASGELWQVTVSTSLFYRQTDQVQFQNSISFYGEQYGNLAEDYEEKTAIWLKTRDYIRKPRYNFEGQNQAQLIWRWREDNVDEIFLYDFSGDQLEKTGVYAYTGESPLKTIYLNKKPNRDLNKVSLPEFQQTIFHEILYDVDFINSSYNLSFHPQPLQCFIGYRSDDEGTHESVLQLKFKEDISFTITTTEENGNIITLTNVVDGYEFYGMISLATYSTANFIYDEENNERGLREGQNILIEFADVTNKKNKYNSYNSGIEVKIIKVYLRTMMVQFKDLFFEEESTKLIHNDKETYLSTTITVKEKEIARLNISGQTEIEDIRYKVNLGNEGKLITADDTFIFKTYDISEEGVDWMFLNKKRKEMLLVKDLIYPYIGSYKAIINAINFFGYNDLEFYEYYRNIDFNSEQYGDLIKIEVPDIFDNTVPGWKENDWIKWTLPNPKFEDTNLFNLTYRITDREGNNVLLYSLAEVITKLNGLKDWLERNVIPITHKILDITGRADFVQTNSIVHKSYTVKSYKISQSMSPVDIALNEAYLMPVNSGSSVYNCVIDFSISDNDYKPDYFELKVKTFKTYQEWEPFKTYYKGQIVSYYQENWESIIDNNRLNNPRKYRDVEIWSSRFDYSFGQIVEYDRNYYVYNATQSSLTITASNPYVDTINGYGIWADITEWRKLNYIPVQSYREFRTATHSFNFTVDTSIDPYILAEVTSDNGYGLIWTTKATFEIRGLANLEQPLQEVDKPGPVKIWDRIPGTASIPQVKTEYIEIWEAISPQCDIQ